MLERKFHPEHIVGFRCRATDRRKCLISWVGLSEAKPNMLNPTCKSEMINREIEASARQRKETAKGQEV